MLRHKCNWVNCDTSVAGRLPLGWARIFVHEPDLDPITKVVGRKQTISRAHDISSS